MNIEKQTSPESPKWRAAAQEGPNGRLQKLATIGADEPTTWSGNRLKRDVGMHTNESYPPLEALDGVELLASDPDHPSSYTYARMFGRSADCYHVVVNGEATANIAQNIPLSKLDITVGDGGELSLLLTGRGRGGETELPSDLQERLAAFEMCRSAAAEAAPEAVVGERPRKRRFGSGVLNAIQRLRNR